MVVRARWTVDIGLDSSVVEHLTSDEGLPGSIPGPATYVHLYFFVHLFIPPIPTTIFFIFPRESQKILDII